MKEKIYYKKGYKYQLEKSYQIFIDILNYNIESDFLKLDRNGFLTIYKGYAWDGPSGPTIDTSNFMRGSLVHDALYQLMREEKLPQKYKKLADILLRRHCREDGMSDIRSNYIYWSVNKYANFATNPKNQKKVYEAPCD